MKYSSKFLSRYLGVFVFILFFCLGGARATEFPVIAEIDLGQPTSQSPRGVSLVDGSLVLEVAASTAEAVYAMPEAVLAESEVLMVVEMSLPPYEGGEKWFNRAKFIVSYEGPRGNPRNRQVMTLDAEEEHGNVTMVVAPPEGGVVRGGEVGVRFERSTGVWQVDRIYFTRGGILIDDSFPWGLPEGAEAVPVKIGLQKEGEQPLNRKLFGFNTNFTRTPFGFDDERTHKLISILKPGLLRFPAGTLSNFYDWRVDGWEGVPSFAPPFVHNASRQMAERRGPRYGMDAFLELCAQQDIAVSFVANITTLGPEVAADWLRHLREIGQEASFWELGNEIYDIRQAPPEVRSGSAYVEWVRPYEEALKAVDPDIKTALVAENGEGWNEEIAHADFANGYVIHTYNKMSGYPFDRYLSRNYLLPERFVDKVLAEYDAVFGDKVRYWNTEWNVRSVLGTPAVFASTLNALHAAGYYLAVLDHQDRFEMACFHQIGGVDDVFGLIHYEDDPETAVEVNRVFLALSLLGECFEGALSSVPLSLDGTRFGSGGHAGVVGRAFVKQDGSLDLFLVNRLPVNQRVVWDDSMGSDVKSTLRVLPGESLSTITRVPLGETFIEESVSEAVVLPPYSVARLSISR